MGVTTPKTCHRKCFECPHVQLINNVCHIQYIKTCHRKLLCTRLEGVDLSQSLSPTRNYQAYIRIIIYKSYNLDIVQRYQDVVYTIEFQLDHILNG